MTDKTLVRRINVSLPLSTLNLLERIAPKGQKSQVISAALEFYVENRGKAELRKAVIEGAKVRGERDRELAEEWFSLEDDMCR